MSSDAELVISQRKKLERKLARFRHVLEKETGTLCSTFPTKNLAICNAGLVNGLTEEIIFEHFSKHGLLKDITLLPGKSCCFVSYESEEWAAKAYKAFNGKLGIAQDKKVIYLLYVDEIPCSNDHRIWGELPPGATLIEDYVTVDQENILLKLCNFQEGVSGAMKNRQVKHFGFEFRYDINNVNKDQPLNEKIPSETSFVWTKLRQVDFTKFQYYEPDQLTINHYLPGQGIPHHVDTHSAFEDHIVCLSLGFPIVMEFKNNDKHLCVVLPQRSLLIMSGESRYNWTHGIVPRKFDIIRNKSGEGFACLKRLTRISFTFRKVRKGDCKCSYKTKCDSFKEANDTLMKDDIAAQLESLHVHDVYANIADHFSDTRHKPWPNVLDFVRYFRFGEILVDVGCGNGKYLGNNPDIYSIGCDRSPGLIDICRGRNIESFIGDCLSIPIKDGYADGVISIAVIHHLANEHRRLKAIKEIVRILRIGGMALIYVWAHDQFKDQKKSSYIMQDRKNRKETVQDSLTIEPKNVQLSNANVALPVHTNRSNFQAKDVLVPWKLKDENKTTFFRFYHVFEENELEKLCQKIENIEILKSFYDQGNWCVVFQKVTR